jgi:hypothetical protein
MSMSTRAWRSPVEIAEHFGVPLDTSGHNLGPEHAIDQVRRHPHRLILFGADWPLPSDAGVRRLPLHPTPCFLWSLVWPERHQRPQQELLLERAVHAGRSEGWLAYDPRQDWLPDTDLAEFHSQPMSQSAEDWGDQLAILTRMLGAGDLTAGRQGSLRAVGVPSAADATAAWAGCASSRPRCRPAGTAARARDDPGLRRRS